MPSNRTVGVVVTIFNIKNYNVYWTITFFASCFILALTDKILLEAICCFCL